jgi:6,7-dimethyl-8-ribityllumazine synthase
MLQNTIQGTAVGGGLKMAVVASRFNDFITTRLLEGCIEALSRHGVVRDPVYGRKIGGPGTL